MNFQDWNVVSWDKRGERSKYESIKDYINNQTRKNNTVSSLKTQSLNSNKIDIPNIKKIENEEDTFVIKTVSLNVSKRIAQKRCEQKLTQKELAFKLNLPEKIIKEYEAGKAVPNHVILNKIEKILGRVRD